MADALVSFVLEQLATLIRKTIVDEVGILVGVQQEIKLLSDAFKDIKDVLNDAEHKQLTEKEGRLKRWIEQVRDVAYDMDDVLDEWNTEIRRCQVEGVDDNHKPAVATVADKKKKVLSYLCTLSSCFYEIKKEVVLRHDIGSRIVDIRERLDSIKNEKRDYGLIKIKSNEKPSREPIRSTSVLLDDDSSILGRKEEKQTIVSMLLGENSNTSDHKMRSLSPTIISIVGMGGLGKTTLAQLVFKDDRVKAHFDKMLWVCVSDPFNIVCVAKGIIVEAGGSAPSSSEWDQELHRCLSKSIEGKLFLLVLDDVWTYDQSIWDRLKSSLVLGALGSQILITTRNKGVASHMDTTYMHHLGLLSDSECLSILDRLVSHGSRKIKENVPLMEIVTKMAKKCKGLPLTAKALGGLLRFKKEKDWESVLGSNIWDLEAEGVENKSLRHESLRPALLLSYYDLSSNLKECFKYCAVFPQDYRIDKRMLINMWMAQGFLFSRGNKQDPESVGEDYFDELVMRSLFQILERDSDGNIKFCTIHDLVHDFASSVSNNLEITVNKNKNTNLLTCSSTTRHLTVLSEDNDMLDFNESLFPPQGNETKKLRTLLFLGYMYLWIDGPSNLFHHLRCLRVLSLRNVSSIPDEISELIHLRFLDLADSAMEMLPETLANLYNLQTLILYECRRLTQLPQSLGSLINLRHINIQKAFAIAYLPVGIKKLTSLRTLTEFKVGSGAEGCKIGALEDLNLLQGKLKISGLESVKTGKEACEARMNRKKDLQVLHMGFNTKDEYDGEALDDDELFGVLQGLEPPPSLEKLIINGYLGSRFPNWMVKFSLLWHLELYDCRLVTEIPALGLLPLLKVLVLRSNITLRRIGPEFYGFNTDHGRYHYSNQIVAFPKLEKLILYSLKALEEWDLGVYSSTSRLQQEKVIIMPCLVRVEIRFCEKLRTISALTRTTSLEELRIQGLEEVKQIGSEFFGIARSGATTDPIFPKLKWLSIYDLISLEEWEDMGTNKQNRSEIMMPQLQSLDIYNLPNLRTLPYHLCRTLTELELSNCFELTAGVDMTSGRPSSTSFSFPLVEELKLYEFQGVFHTYLANFPSLKVLKMKYTPTELRERPFPRDTATQLQWLRYIEVDHCPFCNWDFAEVVQYLPSLQEIHFYNCSREHSQKEKSIISRIPTVLDSYY